MRKVILILLGCWTLWSQAQRPRNVVDEVIWVVGDDPIYLSDVEQARLYAESGEPILHNTGADSHTKIVFASSRN